MRVVLTGIYNASDIRTGSEEVAVSVFREMQKRTETYFVTKYSMIKPHTVWQKLFGLKQDGNLFYCGFLRMPFLIGKLNPDILHGINYHPFVGLLFMHYSGGKTKLCYTVHGVVAYENSRKKYLSVYFRMTRFYTEKQIFKRSLCLFIYDELQKSQISEYYSQTKAAYVLTRNGISEAVQNHDAGKRRSTARLQILTLAGEESRIHGIEVLLDSLIGLDVLFDLKILGYTGPLIVPQALRSKVKIQSKIPQKDFYTLLSNTDIYVCLSLFDSFSIATAEAMALGCTVLISDKVGIRKYIEHGINGFVVNLDQLTEIRKILHTLYNDEILLGQIGRAARIKAESFSWQSTIQEYCNEYRKLTSEAG